MKAQSQMVRMNGYIKILAPPYEACPKCGEMNHADSGGLWRTADERGVHLDCDVCGTSMPLD